MDSLINQCKNVIINIVDNYSDELMEDEFYKALLNKHSQMIKKLKDIIPKDFKNIILEIDALEEEIVTFEKQELYKKGLKDGLKISELAEHI